MVVQDLYPIDPKSDPSNPLFKLISEGVRKISVIFCRISIEMSDAQKAGQVHADGERLVLRCRAQWQGLSFCLIFISNLRRIPE